METSGRSILQQMQPTIGEARIHSLAQAIAHATLTILKDEVTLIESQRRGAWYEEILRICTTHLREDAEIITQSLTLAATMRNLGIGAQEMFGLQPQPTFVDRSAQNTPLEPLGTEGKSSDPDPEPSPSR